MRPIKGWPDYFVTREGDVWSHKYLKPRRLKPRLGSNGYLSVALCRDGRQKSTSIHVLVLESFVGPRPTPKHEGRHLNGDRLDNSVENLAWGTRSENMLDRSRHGRNEGMKLRGVEHPQARLTEEQVRTIRASTESAAALARRFGVGASTVKEAKSGHTWAHV